ncbi:MAG: hypothetical protein JO314_05835 [Acidobacteria bacterium]|nr:hypothetical protein [Acidobacteriota bacterium]
MRHVVGIVIAGLAFAAGTCAVRAIDYAITTVLPVGEEIRAREESQDDYVLDWVVTKPVWLRVNGVSLGTSEREMLRLLGKPQKVDRDVEADDQRLDRQYTYPGLVIGIVETDGRRFVSSIEVTSGDWDISGIKIGSTVDDVQKRFGWSKDAIRGSLSYRDEASDQDFDIDYENGRVTHVFAAYDFC